MSFRVFIGLLFMIVYSNSVVSQSNYPLDTSYTLNSAFQKYQKKYPFIKKAVAESTPQVVKQEAIVYKKIGERALHLDAFLNQTSHSLPAVILIHGGGWKSGSKELMASLANNIAAKGYQCFTIEYRLSPEAKFPAAVFDIKEGVKFVKQQAETFSVDPSKVAVLGCSAGGQLAALVGAINDKLEFEDHTFSINQSDEVQAIVDIDGVLAFKHPLSEEGKVAGEWLGGTYDEIAEVWEKASALNHIDEKTPPMLFIGSKYPRFLAGKEEVKNKLNAHGIFWDELIFSEAPHSFWLFHPWFHETTQKVVTFLDKTLKKI